MTRYLTLTIVCWLGAVAVGRAQPQAYTWQAADSLAAVAPRPVVVFVHTNWCDYCLAMRQTTWRHPAAAALLDTAFYFVPFDAESRAPVVFDGQTYRFAPSGVGTGVHAWAIHLGQIGETIAYPVVCILDRDRQIVFRHSGFIPARDMLRLLRAAAGGG
ncbi:MAG: hypothetical protein OHK0039_14960 [Bacteroidia bacterium]